MTVKDYETKVTPNWCPGCGNFGLWQALKQTLVDLRADPGETVLVAGIGCHGHMNNFTKISSFEGLHGRPIPIAVGIKLANHRLQVIVSTGDGDCLGEGGNHFVHACRRNHDLVVLIHNNSSYSLTTGQASPTSSLGYQSKSTPEGKKVEALDPALLALASGATFVSRGFSGDVPHLQEILKAAIKHRGLAVVEVLQPCVVFNKDQTFDYYRQRIKKLARPYLKRGGAIRACLAKNGRIPIGIFYQQKKPSFESRLDQIRKKPLVRQSLRNFDWDKLTGEFY
ncbi:MAG: 2-oxoacid ferredoxin oxidoreductase [Candidatus Pacebacteria bacterium]|nr:2-oxoacid ferredoxin oxidoreductase [Candidatus Paceibacterota bacterium]